MCDEEEPVYGKLGGFLQTPAAAAGNKTMKLTISEVIKEDYLRINYVDNGKQNMHTCMVKFDRLLAT